MAWVPKQKMDALLREVDRLALDIASLRGAILELASDESNNVPVHGVPAPLVGRPPELLTAIQVAEILNIKRFAVYELARSHRIPSVRIGEGRIRFPSHLLAEWISKGGTTPEENSYFREAEKRRVLRESR